MDPMAYGIVERIVKFPIISAEYKTHTQLLLVNK